jgi:hypothetical protein
MKQIIKINLNLNFNLINVIRLSQNKWKKSHSTKLEVQSIGNLIRTVILSLELINKAISSPNRTIVNAYKSIKPK